MSVISNIHTLIDYCTLKPTKYVVLTSVTSDLSSKRKCKCVVAGMEFMCQILELDL